jgi:hypothetical protein
VATNALLVEIELARSLAFWTFVAIQRDSDLWFLPRVIAGDHPVTSALNRSSSSVSSF